MPAIICLRFILPHLCLSAHGVKKLAQNTGIELHAFPSACPTSMTTESFSIKFCTEVHADIDRGSLISVRTGQTQATLTPTN